MTRRGGDAATRRGGDHATDKDAGTLTHQIRRVAASPRRRVDNILFALLLAVYSAPLILLRHFPSQDGPAHVNNAQVLRFYNDSAHSVLRKYYTLDHALVPNWTGHALLAGALHIAPAPVAERLVVAIVVIGLPLALRYALLAVAPGQAVLALLAFPFVYSFSLHMGFYNFCIGVVLSLIAIGYAQRRASRLAPRDIVVLALLLVAIYFSHIVAWIITVAILSATAKWRVLIASDDSTDSTRWAGLVRRARAGLLPLALAALPSLVLVVNYLSSPAAGTSKWEFPSMRLRVLQLIHFSTIYVFHRADDAFASTLAALFLLLALYTLVKRVSSNYPLQSSDAWGLLTLALFVLFLIVPEGMAGGYYVSSRIELYACLCALLWFATQPMDAWMRAGLRAVAVGIAVGMLALRWPALRELDAQIAEYESAGSVIAPNTTLLAIPFTQRAYTPSGHILAREVAFFLHTDGYIAARRGLVTFDNYEANTAYFPVRFRPGLNPYHTIGNEVDGDFPPRLRFEDYTERTGGRVDNVLIWRMFKVQAEKPETRLITDQLEHKYRLVFTSAPWRFAQVYQRAK